MDDISLEHVTRPSHYLIPTIIVVIGGLFTLWDRLAWVGWLICAVGGLETLWLTVVGVMAQRTEQVRELQWLYTEVNRMDAEARTRLGLAPAPDHITVSIDKSAIVGRDYSKSFRECPLAPHKMKIIALNQLSATPTPFRIREWTPLKDGKLLSDGEWRELIAYLKRPDPETAEIQFIEQKSDNYRDGYDWTEAGKQFLQGAVKAPALRGDVLQKLPRVE